jgi:hypothetical protein
MAKHKSVKEQYYRVRYSTGSVQYGYATHDREVLHTTSGLQRSNDGGFSSETMVDW